MKAVGLWLVVLGLAWGIYSYNQSTSVMAPGQVIGGSYFPSQEVSNLGKMDDRRNALLVAGLAILVGVVLLVGGGSKSAATVQSDQIGAANLNKQCPYCAEQIKLEALVCKHCQRDQPAIAPRVEAPALTDAEMMASYGIQLEGDKYVYGKYRYDKLDYAVAYAKSQEQT